MIIKTNTNCFICEGEIEDIIFLPNLPLTGIFAQKYEKNFNSFDQALQFCPRCKHCQLKNIIDPNLLYNSQYSFLTSNSINSKQSTSKFINFINSYLPMSKIESIIEFGCNDLYFLNQFSKFDIKSIGIDPILKEIEINSDVEIIPDYIENIDFSKYINKSPTLICSQHTIEHIPDIKRTLQKLKSISDKDTIFAFEFPNFDLLLQNRRFDQIFHEHIHYFSLDSFTYLLDILDFELINYEFNYDKWGTLYVLFKNKTNSKQNTINEFTNSKDKILNNFKDFKDSMNITKRTLIQFSKSNVYGYGASMMLPTLNYHLDNIMSNFVSILDDDENKHNKSYINIDIKVDSHKKNIKYENSIFFVTALEHTKNIVKKLTDNNAKNIIVPIGIF